MTSDAEVPGTRAQASVSINVHIYLDVLWIRIRSTDLMCGGPTYSTGVPKGRVLSFFTALLILFFFF